MNELMDAFAGIKDALTGVNQLIALVSTALAVLTYFLRPVVRNALARRFLVRKLKPFYDEQEIHRATENYVQTACQNIDPAQEAEPAHVHAFATKVPLIPTLMKMLESGKADKYYIVLADSGMGKTTFMINFFLRYARRWRKKYKIRLLPLGHPRADAAIDEIDDKENTILLLDAFDEDALAVIDYGERLDQLITKTMDFQTVVLTSRTQFFPSFVQEPAKTGVLKHGGEKGEYEFKKLYVSPFDDDNVDRFIRRKYRLFRWRQRKKARAIVATSPSLMVRPMLLAYIDSLMEEEESYEYAHEIYEAMVLRWIKRERVKDKAELRRFSEAIAVDMYRRQESRKGLFIAADEIEEFARRHGIRLQEFEMKGRSLLNRDAEGRFKFAHKSILEYLLALELLKNRELFKVFDFAPMEFARDFLAEISWRRHWSDAIKELKGNFDLPTGKKSEPLSRLTFGKLKVATSMRANGGVTDEMLAGLLVSGNLSNLDLDSNQIVDVMPLQNLTKLEGLFLNSNQIVDVTPLQNLTKLGSLDLDSNQIVDVTPLQNLTKLSWLDLDSNQIVDVTPLQNLTKLERLDLESNQIVDVTPLQNLTKLNGLGLMLNQIVDLTPLQNLTRLWRLYLSSNQIVDVTPLQNLTKLSELDLISNQIVDVTPLQDLTELSELGLKSNQIVDVTPLQNLTKLAELGLNSNQIVDVTPLQDLKAKVSVDNQSTG